MSLPAHRDPVVIEAVMAALGRLRDESRSLRHVAVVTTDGFGVAAARGADVDDDRFASMASSMQALGDAVARELSIGAGRHILVAASGGHVVQMRVDGHPLVLAALFADSETVGTALAATRRTADRLAASLGGRPAPDEADVALDGIVGDRS